MFTVQLLFDQQITAQQSELLITLASFIKAPNGLQQVPLTFPGGYFAFVLAFLKPHTPFLHMHVVCLT